MATEMIIENPDIEGSCPICAVNLISDSMAELPCCITKVCSECTRSHLRVRIEGGMRLMPCPLCSIELSQEFLNQFLNEQQLHKLELLRINAEASVTRRSCPSCTHITDMSEQQYKQMGQVQFSIKDCARICVVTCSGCSKPWCYFCYAPAHPGISCESNKDGDNQFARWTKGWDRGVQQQNAFRCPKCAIPIQRDGGCPSMTCSNCSCYWCYNCGKSLNSPSYGLLGSHGGDRWQVNACDGVTILGSKKLTKGLRWFKLVQEVVVFSACCLAIATVVLPFLPVLLFVVPPAMFLIYALKQI